jgi:hypothetical protein
MTDTIANDDRSLRAAVSRARSAKPVTVSASGLALHLDCSRAYVVGGEGVLHRAPDGSGFPLDQNRVAYLRYSRRERRQSPRGEADADFQRAKSELIRLRIAENCLRGILLRHSIWCDVRNASVRAIRRRGIWLRPQRAPIFQQDTSKMQPVMQGKSWRKTRVSRHRYVCWQPVSQDSGV